VDCHAQPSCLGDGVGNHANEVLRWKLALLWADVLHLSEYPRVRRYARELGLFQSIEEQAAISIGRHEAASLRLRARHLLDHHKDHRKDLPTLPKEALLVVS